MRVYSLRFLLCLTLAALVSSTAFAGVRGKATKPQEPAPNGRRIAQSTSDYDGVNSRPVPLPTDANITNERVIYERAVDPANTVNSVPNGGPAALRSNTVYTQTQTPMLMVAPMMAQPVMQMPAPMIMSMPMQAGQGCLSCGGGGGYVGLSPANAAIYDQAFGPGLYRSGAEAGQYHFPYYSYRRPWYFPGQPSFHRSTDYVW